MERNFIYGTIHINYIPWYKVLIQYLYFIPNKYNSNIIIEFDEFSKTYIYNLYINNYDIDNDKIDLGAPNLIDQGTTLIMFKKNKCEIESTLQGELNHIFKKNVTYESSIYTSIYYIYDKNNSEKTINVLAFYKDNDEYKFAYNPEFLDEEIVKNIIINMFGNH